jgi:hypothetical protein
MVFLNSIPFRGEAAIGPLQEAPGGIQSLSCPSAALDTEEQERHILEGRSPLLE